MLPIMNEQEYITYPSEGNKKRKATRLKCEICDNTKLFPNRELPNSYICKDCKNKDCFVVCNHCGKNFYRQKSKHDGRLAFCSRDCKEAEQYVGGKMALPHYIADKAYRKKALRFYGHKCNLCDISEDYLLVVHHKDGNRDNNALDNLEVLCHNHHAFRHRFWNGKKWILDTKYNGLD